MSQDNRWIVTEFLCSRRGGSFQQRNMTLVVAEVDQQRTAMETSRYGPMSSETPDGTTLRAEVQFPQNGSLTRRALVSLGALLAYAPFGWWIEAAYPSFAIGGAGLALVVASFPDRLSEWGVPERWTHSLLGAVAVGGLLAASGWWIADHIYLYAGRILVTPAAAARYGFTVGGLDAYGHLITDGLTGTDVRPLWPISGRAGSIDLPALLNPRNTDENSHFIATLVVVAIVVALTSSTVTAAVLSG